jgi:hypothetical protein
MGATMTVTIAHMDWTVTSLANGERVYMNTTGEITGVALIGELGKFSYVVMLDDKTSPEESYNNADYANWNHPTVWGILEALGSLMYEVEQDLIEDAYDTLYSIGEDYDDYDSYEYENDSDLHNEF